jgi:hypothetical protein
MDFKIVKGCGPTKRAKALSNYVASASATLALPGHFGDGPVARS